MNIVLLTGRLGADPEIRKTSGDPVTSFTLATARHGKDKVTDWHKVVVWGKLAEACHTYLSKGHMAGVHGRIQTRTYQDKDGVKRSVTEIVATYVEFLTPPSQSGAKKPEERAVESDRDDDLPF